MAKDFLSDTELGSAVRLAWLSGADSKTLGNFAGLRDGSREINLDGALLGSELVDLLMAGAESSVVGKFTRLRLNQKGERSTPVKTVEQPQAAGATEPTIGPALIESLIDQISQRIKQPIRKREQLRISVDRRPTSVTIDPEVLNAFVAKFGKSEVSKLAKVATKNPPPPGQSRSYQVEAALINALARSDIGQGNVIAFPAGE
jgi:hypothetical protein